MWRRWASAQFVERCQAIRESLDHPALTTDVIVGFPGETEAEFEETLALAEQVRWDSAYTFVYSPRSGTPAPEPARG